MSVREISDEMLDAIANDYITEEEMGGTLMMSAVSSGDWPYVAGLTLMGKSYDELSSHPDIQAFIRKVCAEWGEDFSHAFWSRLDQKTGLATAARAIKRFNKVKVEKGNG